MLAELEAIRRDDPPVANPPRLPTARWVEPRIVIRAEFAEWTTEGLVRQSAYKGREIGKDPKQVVREVRVPTDDATETAERKEARERRTKAPAASTKAPAAAKTPASPTKTGGRGTKKRAAATITAGDPERYPPATEAELAALEAMAKEGNWSIGGHEVRLTNLDKVLFPEDGITKRDLVRYFTIIAPVILPHLDHRALNLQRFPEGIGKGGFWQKEVRSHTPPWVKRVFIHGSTKEESHNYLIADRAATLAFLANEASFEIHPWTSRADAPERPTFALIDIDPGEKSTFKDVLVLGRLYRAALGHLGLTGFPKVTGKRGLQIWVPVEPRYSYHETAAWVEGLSRAVASTVPELVSWEWVKGRRKGLIRLDYTQNAISKTLVAPYAVRPVPGAPVSAPIRWDELDDKDLRSDGWTIRTIGERVAAEGDLFADAQLLEQRLPPLS
jgi:bifunctional non-homologous end joining protein LigD